MRLSPVLTDIDLPSAELQSARLDGELFVVNQCFSPVDQVDGMALRAGSLAARLHSRLIAEQRSAAWVLGVIDTPPVRHELCADIEARKRPVDSTGLTVREVVLDEGDLLQAAGLRFTGPLRTIVDIARFSIDFGQLERDMIIGLARIGTITLQDCQGMLDRRRNLPGKRSALERLRGVLA